MRRFGPMLQAFWRGERRWFTPFLVVLTLPAGLLYGAGVRVRNLLFDHGLLPRRRAPIAVVSVGNLAVGGTGKTPVSAWIASGLVDLGRRPAIVLRGYGDDEVLLHRRWNPEVPVIRAARRIEGVREAADSGCDVAVLDDAFQHRSLARDLDLVLLSPAHPLPPRLLPRGPFREGLRSLRRADAVLVTVKGDAQAGAARRLLAELESLRGALPVLRIPLGAGPWEDLQGVPAPPPGGEVLAVASVADPGSFATLLEEHLADPPELIVFPDHHPYSRADVEKVADRARGRTVVTTEKDAVKLVRFADLLPEARVLPLRARPGAADEHRLRNLLDRIEGEAAGVPKAAEGRGVEAE